MKKTVFFFVIVISSLFLVNCSSSNSPEAVAKKAITAVQKGDYDAYAATFDLSSSDQKRLAGMAAEKMDAGIAQKGGIKNFKIVDSTINGDNATTRVHVVYKDASEDDVVLNLTKVDGEWKQVINK